MVHQLRTQTQRREQNELLERLVSVLEVQAETSRRSQRASWWVSFGSLVIAAASLACAILALTL
ncbi:hypothetical protein [Microbacterium sp. KNMS]